MLEKLRRQADSFHLHFSMIDDRLCPLQTVIHRKEILRFSVVTRKTTAFPVVTPFFLKWKGWQLHWSERWIRGVYRMESRTATTVQQNDYTNRPIKYLSRSNFWNASLGGLMAYAQNVTYLFSTNKQASLPRSTHTCILGDQHYPTKLSSSSQVNGENV